MTIRPVASFVVATTVGILAGPSLSGQSSGRGAPALVVTAHNGGPATSYAAPRTPWGDPDLQGVWSSDDTAGIPLSRPGQFGNRLYLNDQEYATRVRQVESGVRIAENAIGSFRGDFATRAFRQTSLIVDPPDGQMPAVTSQGTRRAAPPDLGTFGNGPFNSVEDFTLYDRCAKGIVRARRAVQELTFGQQIGDDSSLLQGELGIAPPTPPSR